MNRIAKIIEQLEDNCINIEQDMEKKYLSLASAVL